MSRYPDTMILNYKSNESGNKLIEADQVVGEKKVHIHLVIGTSNFHLTLTQTELFEIFKVLEEVIEDWE